VRVCMRERVREREREREREDKKDKIFKPKALSNGVKFSVNQFKRGFQLKIFTQLMHNPPTSLKKCMHTYSTIRGIQHNSYNRIQV